jgi:hypothetical protein
VITYYRSYKKIYLIFSESIPLIYIVSFIFNVIATFCKFHTINKKFSEFIFVNLKEKADIFDKKIHEIKHGLSKNKNDKIDFGFNNGNYLQNNDNKSNNIIINFSDKKNEINKNNSNLPSQKNIKFSQPMIEKIERNLKDNSLEILNYNHKPKEILSYKSNDIKNNALEKKVQQVYSSINQQKEIPISEQARKKSRNINKISFVGNTQIKVQSLFKPMHKTDTHRHYVHKQLFPSRYYFFVIFMKNLDILEKASCFSKKFAKSYLFLSKLLDIYSYFDMFRQFNSLKICLLNEQNLNFIEKNRKINIGEISFMKDIRQCIENNNFRIFGKI